MKPARVRPAVRRRRRLRVQRGYSRERPAELSGMPIDGISNLERALSLPGLDKGGNAAERAGCAGLKLLDDMGRDAGPDPERRRLEDGLLRASRALG